MFVVDPAGTAVLGPSVAVRTFSGGFSKSAAGIGFEIVHDTFRRLQRRDHDMHVIRPDMRGPELPSTKAADIEHRRKNDFTSRFVKLVCRLAHSANHRSLAHRIRRYERHSDAIVRSVYRLRILAMQPCSIGRKSEKIGDRFGHFLFGTACGIVSGHYLARS